MFFRQVFYIHICFKVLGFSRYSVPNVVEFSGLMSWGVGAQFFWGVVMVAVFVVCVLLVFVVLCCSLSVFVSLVVVVVLFSYVII